jgi:hypothetical protein
VIPFILGVTGHRHLSVNSLPSIESGVRERLRELQHKLPNTRIIVASALAEGADRLVAQVALEEGIELWSVLPTSADEYEKDFESTDSRETFRGLLQRSTRTLNASALAGRDASASERPQIYVDVGAEICRLSHALLAVWDGKASVRPGGTGDIVAKFRSGQFEGASDSALTFPDCGEVFHIHVDEDVSNAVANAHRDRLLYPQVEGEDGEPIMRGGGQALHVRFEAGLRSLNAFNRDSQKGGQTPDNKLPSYMLPNKFPWQDDPVLAAWLIVQDAANTLSSQAQKRRHRALITVVLLFACSMMATLLYGGLVTEGYWPLPLGLLFIGAATVVYILRKTDHDVWIGYRALAEFLRVAISWRACGVHEPVHYVLAEEQILAQDWLGMAVRWFDNEARLCAAKKFPDHTAQQVADHWITDQINYFSDHKNKGIHRHAFRANLLGKISMLFIGLALSVDVLTMVIDHFLAVHGRAAALGATAWSMYVYWALLGLSAVVATYADIMAHGEHASEYSHALIKFRLAKVSLAKASTEQERYDLLSKLGKSAVRETASWFRLHLGRPLRLPF